jgi:hypothetical protein
MCMGATFLACPEVNGMRKRYWNRPAMETGWRAGLKKPPNGSRAVDVYWLAGATERTRARRSTCSWQHPRGLLHAFEFVRQFLVTLLRCLDQCTE